MRLHEIASAIHGELIGDPNCDILGLCVLHAPISGYLTFVLDPKQIEKAAALNVAAFVSIAPIPKKNCIVVKHGRKALAQTIALFMPKIPPLSDQPIDPSAKIDRSCQIGTCVTIGANAVIGADTIVMPQVCIGAHVKIGARCRIYPGAVLYDYTQLGNDVIVHAGAVIGSDGFGYYQEQGKQIKIPHIGRVVIEDGVEIHANTSIARGCLGETRIGCGTKIDNLCHIAHNTIIGEDCAITAQFGCLGSACVGNRVYIGGQSGIADVKIDDDVIVAGRSGVTKDVAPKQMISGFPAWPHQHELIKESLLRKMVYNYIDNRKKQKGKKGA